MKYRIVPPPQILNIRRAFTAHQDVQCCNRNHFLPQQSLVYLLHFGLIAQKVVMQAGGIISVAQTASQEGEFFALIGGER